MKNRLIDFCGGILEHDSYSFYSAVANFFQEYSYTEGYINTLQAIYDVSGNNSYLIKIGDYFKEIGQNEIAFSYYNKCLKSKVPDIYEKIEQTKPCICYSQDPRKQYGNDKTLIRLINKNVVLVHLLKLALDCSFYEIVIEYAQNLHIIADLINEHIKLANEGYASTINNALEIHEVFEDYNFLSNELAKTKHHNDINNLAIELNPNNQAPYFNIMDDYIVYENPKAALEYYNSVYQNQFQSFYIENLKELYQIMHNFFHKIGDYYKVVYYQKLIIEGSLKQ